MRIATNVVSINSKSRLDKNINELDKESRKLATGDRINRAAYDPAGLIISEGMKTRIRSYAQANRNANDSISMIQVAEGSLSSIQSMAARMKELALQSANDTYGSEDRARINSEFQQMKREIKRIVEASQFNGRKILDRNAGVYEFQVGINSSGPGERVKYDMSKVISSSKKVSLGSHHVSTKYGARDAISEVDSMLEEVSGARAFLGATQTRIQSTMQNLQISRENTAAANSRIRDTDIADSTAKKAIVAMKTDASVNVLSQANALTGKAKELIES